MADQKRPERIAYLTGEYPAVSHTFILREVEALRARGLDILTCSIRQTSAEHHRGHAEKQAAFDTFYVIKAAKNPFRLLRAQLTAMARPRAYFTALILAWRTRPPGLRAAMYQFFYFLEATILAHHLRQQNVAHLHNHFGNSSCSVAMLTSVLSEIPFSYTMHGPAIFFEPRFWRIDEKIARARFVACISHFCRSQGMIFSDPKHWTKMHIVHCGITPDLYETVPQKKQGKRIIFVGRLAAVKGLPVLIEAFARAREDNPDATLTLVGDGVERPVIEDLVSRLGCAEAVDFLGYLSQQEVADELAKSDILALPSFAEGVPVVLMEAMASRLPVLATRIAGISELIEDDVSGLTVPPGNVQAMTAALNQLLSNPEKRRSMGNAGRATVEEFFDIDNEAARLEALFNGDAPADPRGCR